MSPLPSERDAAQPEAAPERRPRKARGVAAEPAGEAKRAVGRVAAEPAGEAKRAVGRAAGVRAPADEGAADPGPAEPEPAAKAYELTTYTRQPIVSVLGHVDHGKTSLLDRVRGTSVAAREPGAITQHIGATEVPLSTIEERCKSILGGKTFQVPGLLFIDTPGHSAFTTLRSRGGALADIAVVVVDVNEGFKPQTKEALSILRGTKTPFVIAANKIDLIHGWKSTGNPFVLNVRQQTPEVLARFDERLYQVVGQLYETVGRAGERYDRVEDFTKIIAIVPVSAKTGEGIADLLMILVGLAQRFLERRLETTETGPAIGTILEVKEEKGLGVTLDTIVYSGLLRSNDTVLVGTRGEPVRTKVKALLRPKPLDEIRDPRDPFDRVKEVHAAAGIKLLVQETEGIQAGAPLRVLRPENEEALLAELSEAAKPGVELHDAGILIKADSIGALEALGFELKKLEIPIRKAEVGDVSRRDVVEAATSPDPLHRIILSFNVKVLPDAATEMRERDVAVLNDNVIYTLIEGYRTWQKEAKVRLDAAQRESFVHPGMVKFLAGCTFRASHPAVIGVRVLVGQIQVDQSLIREDGREVGAIESIQLEKRSIPKAIQGAEVAVAIKGVTVGRQISEEDILLIDVPEGDVKKLRAAAKLTSEEDGVLERLIAIKRKTDRFWGM